MDGIPGGIHRLIHRFGMTGTIALGTLFSIVGSVLITSVATYHFHPTALAFAVILAALNPLLLAPVILYVVLRLLFRLQGALDEIRTLSGLLPICSYCRKIRDEKDQWDTLESYVSKHSDTVFSHGICPACKKREVDPFLERIRNR